MRLRSLTLAFLASLVIAGQSFATPLQYYVNMTAPTNSHPILSGAGIEMTISWDPEGLTPLFDDGSIVDGTWTTTWPVTNTVASMKITGTASHDGVYPGGPAVVSPGGWFHFNNQPAIGDALRFPRLEFPFNGGSISILSLEARFADTFHQSLSTIFPKPFAGNEATWVSPIFLTSNPAIRDPAVNVSGFAITVPEPSTFVLAGLVVSAVAMRRRK